MFDYLHPNMQGPWIFDGFSAHKCFSTSAPQVSKMNPKPGDSSVQQKSSYNPPLQTAKINELSTWSKNQRKWPDSLKLWSMFLLSMGYGVNTSTKIILWDLKVCFPSVRLLRRLDLKKKCYLLSGAPHQTSWTPAQGRSLDCITISAPPQHEWLRHIQDLINTIRCWEWEANASAGDWQCRTCLRVLLQVPCWTKYHWDFLV